MMYFSPLPHDPSPIPAPTEQNQAGGGIAKDLEGHLMFNSLPVLLSESYQETLRLLRQPMVPLTLTASSCQDGTRAPTPTTDWQNRCPTRLAPA
jgi:hypothetical protein